MMLRARHWPILLLMLCSAAVAHEVRPAYLELVQVEADSYDVAWKVPARGDDLRLALYVAFPDGTKTVGEPRGLVSGGHLVQRWRIERAGGLEGETIEILGLRATLTDALARVQRLDGTTQIARMTPSNATFVVAGTPSGIQIAGAYFQLGVAHILEGLDHLLFVFAMLLLVGWHWSALLKTISSFTVAHSITLALATLGVVHVPQPPVEAIIALSIVFVARELARMHQGHASLTSRWPWAMAFAFGLLHGFGFAGALSDVGLPQTDIPVALLFFNVGVEAGQLLFVAVALALLFLLRRARLVAPAWTRAATHYGIGAIAVFWFMQRIATW